MELVILSCCLHCSEQQVSLCFSRCIQRFMAQLHPFQCFSHLLGSHMIKKRRDYLCIFLSSMDMLRLPVSQRIKFVLCQQITIKLHLNL